MEAWQVYLMLLVTAVMMISGLREIVHRNWALGALMLTIPTCGWAAIALGR